MEPKNMFLFKRENIKRIFSNRDIYMEKIKIFGLDLDYTIVEYISPYYQQLVLKYSIEMLIEKGYPANLRNIKYDPRCSARGVIFDKKFGNFLKVDATGNILSTIFGLSHLNTQESRELYTDRYIDLDDTKRYATFNSLFELPSMFLICEIIDMYNKDSSFTINDKHTAFVCGSIFLTYKHIYTDVAEVFERVFKCKEMKKEIIQNLERYVIKDIRLPMLLDRMKRAGKKIFLITNNDYWYTNNVLEYLFKDSSTKNETYSDDWQSYFDLIVVDAEKPGFFEEGSAMRQIDIKTGQKFIGKSETCESSKIYSGGTSSSLCQILGCHEKEIMYIGDRILGELLKSKRKQAWRTFLIVPELIYEMSEFIESQVIYQEIQKMDSAYSNANKNMDSLQKKSPINIDNHISNLKKKTVEIEKKYGLVGSLFRSGFRQTYFASKVATYADLYSHTFLNFIYYPFFYLFRGPHIMLAHELTLNIDERIENNDRVIKFIGMKMEPSFD